MPLHFEDLDVTSEVAGLSSALIVPCNMCPAVTVAARENKPFLRLFRNFLRSDPFERHIRVLQYRLLEQGVRTKVFKSRLPHQWFLCMATSGRRERLRKEARRYDAAVVLGCETATETVRDALQSTGCKVIEGMETVGFLNAKMKFQLPGNVSFEDCRVVPMSRQKKEENLSC
jgi:hypothetical protein